MDEKILEQLKLLNKYTQYLKEISTSDKESFVADFKLRGSAERYLHLSIESCINIGNRLLSILQLSKPVSTPETYADIFKELGKIKVIPKNFMNTMIEMVKFRNRIVHMYWDIDPHQLYDIINDNIEDFSKFVDYIVEYMNREHI